MTDTVIVRMAIRERERDLLIKQIIGHAKFNVLSDCLLGESGIVSKCLISSVNTKTGLGFEN